MKVIKRKPIYVAADGRKFKTEKECLDYEALAVSLQDYAHQVKEVFNQNIKKADGWSRIKRIIVNDINRDDENECYYSDRQALMLLLRKKKYFLTQFGVWGDQQYDIYDRFDADGNRVVENGRINVRYCNKSIFVEVENGTDGFYRSNTPRNPLKRIVREHSDRLEQRYKDLLESLQF